MPQPRLDTDNTQVLREQFEAWMEGANARAQGVELVDCPYASRSRKGDAWKMAGSK